MICPFENGNENGKFDNQSYSGGAQTTVDSDIRWNLVRFGESKNYIVLNHNEEFRKEFKLNVTWLHFFLFWKYVYWNEDCNFNLLEEKNKSFLETHEVLDRALEHPVKM